jgi:hypothetical protein
MLTAIQRCCDGGGTWGLVLIQFQVDPFVVSAFALIVRDPNSPDFASVADVSSPVCLQVKAGNFHHANLSDVFWKEIDLGADKIRYLESLLPRDGAPGYSMGAVDLIIHSVLDQFHQFLLQ